VNEIKEKEGQSVFHHTRPELLSSKIYGGFRTVAVIEKRGYGINMSSHPHQASTLKSPAYQGCQWWIGIKDSQLNIR